jgi:F-type H+-transporting ATPase subunit b
LAVFFILKKFAFGAVFQMLDERQGVIASLIEEAEQKAAELESVKKDYEQRLCNLDQEGHQRIQVAIAEGERIAGEIREKAQLDAAVQLEYAKKEIQRETESARAMVQKEVIELSVLMAGKLITKNLSNEENERFVLDLLSQTGEIS